MSHVLNACLRSRLTVLTYHRIVDSNAASVDGFRPTVSATSNAFVRQIEFLASHCHVVPLSAVVAAIRGEHQLPPRAALITFDDGYRDNIDVALPLLAARKLSAAVFLSTNHVGGEVPFFWDVAAFMFDQTGEGDVQLPLVGHRRWTDAASRAAATGEFVHQLKQLTDEGREAALAELAAVLGVSMRPGALSHLHMTWEDVRRGARLGLEFGSHTMRHAMLPRLGAADASAELTGSKARIERELGVTVAAFAYPNGDSTPRDHRLVQEAGYEVAFSSRPGPCSVRELRTAPFDVRRVEVVSRQTLEMFAANLVGLSRIA